MLTLPNKLRIAWLDEQSKRKLNILEKTKNFGNRSARAVLACHIQALHVTGVCHFTTIITGFCYHSSRCFTEYWGSVWPSGGRRYYGLTSRGDSHMKGSGMLVVSVRVVKNATIFSSIFQGALKEITKNRFYLLAFRPDLRHSHESICVYVCSSVY